jgi:isoquinoline 1-oxidoreductase beta subunit
MSILILINRRNIIMNVLNLSRRNFLKSTAVVTGGFVLGFHLPSNLMAQFDETANSVAINAWLHIGTDETITVLVANSEMGQGVYTSLPMLVAEELEADWQQIKIQDAPVDDVYKNPAIGAQITCGSTSVRSRWDALRQAGAAAREMLIQVAANRWQVEPASCQAMNGKVVHQASGKTFTYGELATAAAQLTPPTSPSLKSPDAFKLIGQPVKRLDTREKVNGSAVFGIDVKVANMLIATVKQAPVFGSHVKSYDLEAAKNLQVVEIPNGIAVVDKTYWQAKQGLERIKVQFTETEHDKTDTASIDQLLKNGLTEDGAITRNQGDVTATLESTAKTLDVEYSAPFLAHATMEPMTCTAEVTKDRCEIWAPTQAQGWVQQTAAKLTGLPTEKIIIHTTFLGGGFGRRVEMDFISQAILIAQKVGQPVKVIWSREEDMQHDVYRPAARVKFTAGLNDKGQLTALKSRIVSPSIFHRVMPQRIKNGVDRAAVEGISDSNYDIPNQYSDYVMKNTHVPVGFWRSVGHSQNAFFIESFIDEIAHHSNKDPYQFRRQLLLNQPAFLKVLDTVAEKADWQQPLLPGRFRGIAIHKSFASIVSEVAEISVSQQGAVKVHRVVCVVDCGIAVNPNIIAAQMESAIIYGLSALKQIITVKNGYIEQSNFHDFPLLTLTEAPKIEVHIIPSTASPGGVGEPATPPIIPAVTNAIFAATGKRIRQMPFDNKEFRLI